MGKGDHVLDDGDPEIGRKALEALGAAAVPLCARPVRDGFPYVEEGKVRVDVEACEWVGRWGLRCVEGDDSGWMGVARRDDSEFCVESAWECCSARDHNLPRNRLTVSRRRYTAEQAPRLCTPLHERRDRPPNHMYRPAQRLRHSPQDSTCRVPNDLHARPFHRGCLGGAQRLTKARG